MARRVNQNTPSHAEIFLTAGQDTFIPLMFELWIPHIAGVPAEPSNYPAFPALISRWHCGDPRNNSLTG
jgi:hypothetical protein